MVLTPIWGRSCAQLAQTILDRLDPAVRLAAARAASTDGGPGKCQQVWCPVCALAALVSGEQHPLLTVVAEHSVALVTVSGRWWETIETDPTGPPTSPPPDEPPPAGPEHGSRAHAR